MDNNNYAGRDSEGTEEHDRETIITLGNVPNCHKQTVSRSINIKGSTDEGSRGNKEHIFENRRKEDPCYVVAESLAELLPLVIWKGQCINCIFC